LRQFTTRLNPLRFSKKVTATCSPLLCLAAIRVRKFLSSACAIWMNGYLHFIRNGGCREKWPNGTSPLVHSLGRGDVIIDLRGQWEACLPLSAFFPLVRKDNSTGAVVLQCRVSWRVDRQFIQEVFLSLSVILR
jgi:hypothetical protein